MLLHPWLTGSTLCKETRIPNSKIYYVLDSLLKKGLVIVQRGRPNIYKALPPEEAITNLIHELEKEFAEKTERAKDLIARFSPIYNKFKGSESIELAYVLQGRKVVINKINEIIKSSTKNFIVFIPDSSFLSEIEEALLEAKNKGVRINLALASNVQEIRKLRHFGNLKLLSCPCCMLISDNQTLLTVHGWKSETCYAILTHDPNLVMISREYYENPKCCTDV